MEYLNLKQSLGFYENELVNKFLTFWLPRCVDHENGGFVNCFDNHGEKLISKDKYVWSQGRFVWVFSKLASLEAPIFSSNQRKNFLALAKHGTDFLMKHCLMDNDDWRCIFLLDEKGKPKLADGCKRLDMSIYADCFVAAGIAKYSDVSHDKTAFDFAKNLYLSILERVRNNTFETLPYPLSKEYRAHGIPMILANVSRDVYFAAKQFEPALCEPIKSDIKGFTYDILDHFVDEDYLLHEIITRDNQFFPKKLGNHINPGHTLEDAWFLLDSLEITEEPARKQQIYQMVLKALDTGWDDEYGGLLHFASVTGGEPEGDNQGLDDEPMSKQLSGWGDKLWWVHSEALYTTLRCYLHTEDERFLLWYNRLFDYTYRTFPNEDPEIREWIQIHTRDGKPEDKVVALPVKDPYHIMRNLCLMIELLYNHIQ